MHTSKRPRQDNPFAPQPTRCLPMRRIAESTYAICGTRKAAQAARAAIEQLLNAPTSSTQGFPISRLSYYEQSRSNPRRRYCTAPPGARASLPNSSACRETNCPDEPIILILNIHG